MKNETEKKKTPAYDGTLTVEELEALKCPDCGHCLTESSVNNAYDELHLHCVPAFRDFSLPEGKENGCGTVIEYQINFKGNPRKEDSFTFLRKW